MKNFVLLFSSLAIASSAFAAGPVLSKLNDSDSKCSVQRQKMTATSNSKVALGSFKSLDKNPKFVSRASEDGEGKSVSYNEPEGLFALGLSEDFMGYDGMSVRRGPAYFPLTWKNTSVGYTEFDWEVIKDFATGETQFFTTVDFTHSELYSETPAPVLYGMDNAGNAAVFQFGAKNSAPDEIDPTSQSIYYLFGGDCVENPQTGEDYGMTTYMYGNGYTLDKATNKRKGYGFTTFPIMSYNTVDTENFDPSTGLENCFTDKEDGYGYENPVFVGFANEFKKPAAPYLISKMWSWMSLKAKKATKAYMTLYKIDQEGFLTDEILASGEASIDATKDANINPDSGTEDIMVTFDLYSLDEDGLETEDPIVIDCAFMAVLEVQKEDFEIIEPVCGAGARSPINERINYPRNAKIVINVEGEDRLIPSPYIYGSLDGTQYIYVTDYMWMVDATFPWLLSADDTIVAQAPVEGGVVSFNIDAYFSLLNYDYHLIPDDCDWIDLETANVTVNQELGCQVLNVPVAALPEGVDGRGVTIDIEGMASSMKLYIDQGNYNAVNAVVVDKKAEYYDLQGRRVANPEKGIYIKKSGNKAEKIIL